MKKLNRTAMLLLAALMALSAQAFKITLNAPGDNQIQVKVQTDTGIELVTLNGGDNEFEVSNYNSLDCAGISPWQICGVSVNGVADESYFGGNTWYKFLTNSDAGKTFTFATKNLDEGRTASCTVNIDDPSKVSASFGYNAVTLEPGANTVKFNPETETTLTVRSKDYSPLYNVSVDGTKIEMNYGGYAVPLSQDCAVDITAIIPDIDVTLSFSYDAGCEDAFERVEVNGNTVEFDGISLAAKAGNEVNLYPGVMYEFPEGSVKFNGQTLYRTYYGYYTFVIMEDSQVTVSGLNPLPTYTATVKIDDPSHILFYGSRTPGDESKLIRLNPGENTLKVLQDSPAVSWKAAPGFNISAVSANGTDLTTDFVNITEGMVLEFTTGEVVMDKKAIFWFDNFDMTENFYFFNFKDADGNPAPQMQTGYNTLRFNADMTPYNMTWMAKFDVETTGKVYINETEFIPEESYPGEGFYTLDLNDGDVVKVYFETEPEICNVAITLGEGVTASVVRDLITPVEDFAEGFTAFKGTSIKVTPQCDKEFTVMLGETELQPAADGSYEFTVTSEATELVIEPVKKEIDGLEISVDGITAGYAFINITPEDQQGLYFWNCAERELYDAVGPTQVITNTLDAWYEFSQITGMDIAVIMSQMGTVGDMRRIEGPLKAGTEYAVYAFGLDASLHVTVPTKVIYFTTLTPTPSSNTFQVEVKGVEPAVDEQGKKCTTVTVEVTPSNDDPYTLFCAEKYLVDQFDLTPGSESEKEFAAEYVVKAALAHTYTGKQLIEVPGVMVNAMMYAVVTGVDQASASTPVSLTGFSTIDQDLDALTVTVTDPSITDAHVTVTPFESSRAFYWGVLKKSTVEEIGGAENIYEQINKPFWESEALWYGWQWWEYAAAVLTRSNVDGSLCNKAQISPRKWDTDYVVYAYLVDEGGNKVSPTYTAEFHTLPRNVEDLTFTLDVTNVSDNATIGAPGSFTVEFLVTPSDESKPWAVYYREADDFDSYEDLDDFMYEIFMPKVKKTYKGSLEFGHGSVKPDKEYVLVCSGYDEAPNTDACVMRYSSQGKLNSIDTPFTNAPRVFSIPGAIVIDGSFDSAEIFSLQGARVASTTSNCVRGLDAGLYVVRVLCEGKISTAKVLVKPAD